MCRVYHDYRLGWLDGYYGYGIDEYLFYDSWAYADGYYDGIGDWEDDYDYPYY